MPPTRVLASIVLRNARSSAPRARQTNCLNVLQRRTAIAAVPRAVTQVRWQSQDSAGQGGSSKVYGFDDIKALVSGPSKDKILIDVREPGELQNSGKIPGALNIPITSQPDSFFLSPEDFEDRYGFEQPPKDAEVVFYCKAGVRSRAAAELARQGGWKTTGEYPGSWVDWHGKGGEVERK